jgi:RimJ/RimL family protein N-acetyltransferase
MIFESKSITLKSGQAAILKTPSVDDAPKMLSYITKACGETEFLVRYPEEWSCISVESEEKWIKNARASKNKLIVTCYISDEIVGNAEINFFGERKTRHRSTLAIAILKEFWEFGIGSALFTELLSAASNHSGTEIIELEFIEGNERARALYEKFGFQIVGERPNAFRLRDGSYRSEIFMQKKL